MDKNAKKIKAAKAKAEETALNHILCWIAGGVVLEFLLLLLDRYYTYYTVGEYDIHQGVVTAVKILAVAALACAAAAGYWWRNARQSGKSAYLPGTLCAFLAGVSVSCFVTWSFSSAGLKLMYLVVPAFVVLVLIYYLYQREFFLIVCECALALLGVWVCARGIGSSLAMVCYAYGAVAILLVLAAAAVCKKAQDGRGEVALKEGKTFRLFPKDANYVLLYVGAAVSAAALIAAMVELSAVLLYAVLVAWLLIMAVYYTVKMM